MRSFIVLSLAGISWGCFFAPAPASKCEAGWQHSGSSCYKLFTDKVWIYYYIYRIRLEFALSNEIGT